MPPYCAPPRRPPRYVALNEFGTILLSRGKEPFAIAALEGALSNASRRRIEPRVKALARRLAVVSTDAGDTVRAARYYDHVYEQCKQHGSRKITEIVYIAELLSAMRVANGLLTLAKRGLRDALCFVTRCAEEERLAHAAEAWVHPLMLRLAEVCLDGGSAGEAVRVLENLLKKVSAGSSKMVSVGTPFGQRGWRVGGWGGEVMCEPHPSIYEYDDLYL